MLRALIAKTRHVFSECSDQCLALLSEISTSASVAQSKSHSYTLKLFMLPFYFCYCKYVPSFKWTNKNLFLLMMNRIIVIPELSFPSQVPYSHVRRPTVFHCEAKKTVNIRNISAILLNFNHNHKLH